jgi:hypothetical protein
VQRLLALALVLTSCAGSGSPEVQLDAGDCIAGTAAIENVPCDDPAAEYRLLRPATSIAVPEPGCDDGEVLLARGDGEPRRAQVGTRPYIPEDDNPSALPPRRPTVSFSAFSERNPPSDKPTEVEDEDAVETAIERLARIRARRNARRSSS